MMIHRLLLYSRMCIKFHTYRKIILQLCFLYAYTAFLLTDDLLFYTIKSKKFERRELCYIGGYSYCNM